MTTRSSGSSSETLLTGGKRGSSQAARKAETAMNATYRGLTAAASHGSGVEEVRKFEDRFAATRRQTQQRVRLTVPVKDESSILRVQMPEWRIIDDEAWFVSTNDRRMAYA